MRLEQRSLVCAWLLLACGPTTLQAQTAAPFAPGGQQLVLLDFAGFPLGDFVVPPRAGQCLPGIPVCDIRGELAVVMHDGVPMLRAAGRSSFVVRLPRRLPNDFTLEFDLISKTCCQPEDLSFEGVADILNGQTAVSANVLWHHNSHAIVGGVKDQGFSKPMPEKIRAAVMGSLANIAVTFRGPSLTMYTNDEEIYTVQREFVRGSVLRVFLGGQNDTDRAVYLARLRIAGGPSAVATGPSALSPSSNPVPNVGPGGTATATSTNASTDGGNPAPGTTLVQNVTVTLGPNGPIVNWQHGTAPSVFTVQRWKADDPNCCNNTSPASPPVTGPPWQDSPPPLSGTYTYRVTATSSSGSAMAGTDFVYTRGTGGRGTIVAEQPANPRNPSTNTTPTVPSSRGSGAGRGTVASGLTVTVTMSRDGPVVTWPAVPRATGYRATRSHIDDANCCNTTSGSSPTATSPWQDQPLPRDGPYLYQVVAETPAGPLVGEARFAFRLPGANPNPDPFAPSTPPATGVPGPTQPASTGPGALGPSPRGASRPNAPASPRFVIVNPTPTTAQFSFDVVTGATSYRIRRSVSGSGVWSDLTPTPIPAPQGNFATNSSLSPYLVDAPLDHRQTYTYELHALQADNTYGTTTLTHTPPAPADPSGFKATALGPGQVRLEWTDVPLVKTYRISGPGTGSSGSISAAEASANSANQYTLSGIAAGSQRWTIASEYTPGGVLTPANAWPTATATVAPPDPAPRYRLVVLGFQVDQQSTDVNDARDGKGDEVYFTAIVNRTTLSGLPMPVVKEANVSFHATRSHGDEAVSVPYGRIRAGTASSTGGLKTGDLVPATLDLNGPTPPQQTNSFPLILWEGDLENDAVVIVHPALWEDDLDPRVQGNWTMLVSNEARGRYEPNSDQQSNTYVAIAERDFFTRNAIRFLSGSGPYYLTPVQYGREPLIVAPEIYDEAMRGRSSTLFQCTTVLGILVRRPCEAHGVDRPIGLRGGSHPGSWVDPVIVLTKAGVLNSSALQQRSFSMTLYDDVGTPTEATAKYKLHFRLERIP